MPTTVPTAEEFAALEARVAVLERGQQPTPPMEGVQAKRIADVIELFGVNTFSSLDEHNVWGSWPADYRPDTVIAALDYLTGDSDYAFRIREYHYASRTEMQREWLDHVTSALPDTQVSICIGANGTTNDVPSMIGLWEDDNCGIVWLEGLNEPNTDFGHGVVPVPATVAIQQGVWSGTDPDTAMGPSIVAGMPHPEEWIKDYCGGFLGEINAASAYGNGHYYPPHCPDLVGDGTSLSEYVGGLWSVYAQHPIMITEFHPTLYNNAGHAPGHSGWNGERDAYYMLLTLFRAAKCGVTGLWWYALFDYGTTYICGLFPKDASNPRPAATALRNLCQLCIDRGENMRTFTPGKLGITVSGLPEHADWDLYQNSDGTFRLALWRAAAELGGMSDEVTFDLTIQPSELTMFDLVSGEELAFADRSTMSFSVDLDASCRMIFIVP